MSFDVKRTDVDEVGFWMASYASQVAQQLAQVASAAQRIQSLDSFQGQTAESVKAYWGEAHVTCAAALATALAELSARYEEYMSGYGSIDGARDARFEDSALTITYSQFSSSRSDLAGKARSLSSAVGSVSDLIGGWSPSTSAVNSNLAELADKARDIRIKVEAHETTHLARASATNGLIDAARQAVASLGGGGAAGSYVPGSISSAPWAEALDAGMSASKQYRAGRADAYEVGINSLSQRRQERYDEEVARRAEERAQNGRMQMGLTAVGFLIGAVAVIASGGTAAPIVIGVMGAFATAEFVEGAQDFYYGSTGDITSLAFNPIRDTVFLGNQALYDAGSFVITTAVAGAAAPAVMAVGVARATGTSVLKAAAPAALKGAALEIGRDGAVTIGAAYTASRLTDGNQTAVQLAMMGATSVAGMVGGKGFHRNNNHHTNGGSGSDPVRISNLRELDEKALASLTASKRKAFDQVMTDPDVLNSGTRGQNNMAKGNLGELSTDALMAHEGYQRISIDYVQGLDSPNHQGIDGIYFKEDGHPPYVITETKYSADGHASLSKLTDGTKQMSDKWVDGRLEKALGKNSEHQDIIERLIKEGDGVGKRLVQIDGEFNVRQFELDAGANKTKEL